MIEAPEVFDVNQPLSEVRSVPHLRLVTPEVVDSIADSSTETYQGQHVALQEVRAELDDLYDNNNIQLGYN